MELFLVWDCESETTKDSTLLTSYMKAVDDGDSDAPKPKKRKTRRDDDSSDSGGDETDQSDDDASEEGLMLLPTGVHRFLK